MAESFFSSTRTKRIVRGLHRCTRRLPPGRQHSRRVRRRYNCPALLLAIRKGRVRGREFRRTRVLRDHAWAAGLIRLRRLRFDKRESSRTVKNPHQRRFHSSDHPFRRRTRGDKALIQFLLQAAEFPAVKFAFSQIPFAPRKTALPCVPTSVRVVATLPGQYPRGC